MRIILVFLIILSFSCKKENKSTFFGGKILNKSSNKIILNKDNNLFKDALISKDGMFKMKFDSLSSGLYNFFLQPEFQYVILEKNDSLLTTKHTFIYKSIKAHYLILFIQIIMN